MRPGEMIAERFEIERLVGSGGMGHVYRARDLCTGNLVALKMLQRTEPADIERFAREAQILSMLDHPGIVRYIAYGATPGEEPHLVMEWLEGETLFARLEQAPLTLAETLAIGRRVAAALGVAHRSAIVHRDIKPGNIFLRGGSIEDATLLDFGIARRPYATMQLTTTGAMMGTPGYMAPEQARGAPDVDVRADVFSLGCVLFRCLSGRPAFTGDDAISVLFKVVAEEPPRLHELRPEIPRELDDLVAQMLSKSPDSRPRDGDAVAAELAAIMSGSAPSPPCSGAKTEITSTARQVMCMVLARGSSKSDAPLPSAMAAERARALCAVAERHQGRLEILGDGSVLILFSGADTATDLAARAARCALAIRSLLDGVPVVVVSGRDILGPRLPAGELIDRAVQLLSSTESVTRVRVDAVTAGLLDASFDIDLDADGTGTWLSGQLRDPDGTRLLLGKPTMCMGRERELGQIELIFTQCVEEPVASAALLTASAGVGKSRICHEFLCKLRGRGDAVEIWIARGDSLRAGSAFGLLGQALRGACGIRDGEPLSARRNKIRARVAEHVPDGERVRVAEFLGELVGTPFADEASVALRAARQDAQLMGDQMRRAWVDFLGARCSAKPVLLVLEDLHWGDLPTVRFIDEGLRRLKDKPWMVLALARPEVHDLFPKLWDERSVQEIRVKELSPKASARLVRQVLGDGVSAETVERLVTRADGNAFYLEELIRAAAEGNRDAFPETVLAMVQSRLERLDSAAQRVIRGASVFGESFWAGGVAALLGGTERDGKVRERLRELVAREVLIERAESRFAGEEEMAFRHALLREGAYAMLTDQDRALGHRLAGEWLEQRGEQDMLALAEHFEKGGDGVRAGHCFLRAAERALASEHGLATMEYARRGLAGPVPEALRQGLLGIRCEAAIWHRELLSTVLPDAEELGQVAPRGSVSWVQGMCVKLDGALQAGRLEEFMGTLAVLQGIDPIEDTVSALSLALSMGSYVLYVTGQIEAGNGVTERLATIGAALEDRAPLALIFWHLVAAGTCSFANWDPWKGLSHGHAGLALIRAVGHGRLFGVAQILLSVNLWYLGATAEAERLLKEVTIADEEISYAAHLRPFSLAWLLADRGAFDEARARASQFVASGQARRLPLEEGPGRWVLAEVLRRAGELDTAEAEIHAALTILAMVSPLNVPGALATLAALRLAQARPAEALAAAQEGMVKSEAMGAGSFFFRDAFLFLIHAECLEAAGDHAGARAAIAKAKRWVLTVADKIGDPAYGKSYLENVPENRRILELAREWLGEPAAAPP